MSYYHADVGEGPRLAIYVGGDTTDGPEGATLLHDFGPTLDDGVNNQWETLDVSGFVALPQNTLVWFVMKGDSNTTMRYNDTVINDFHADGRHHSDGFNNDPDVAFPGTWPVEAGSMATWFYNLYITYSLSSESPSESPSQSASESPSESVSESPSESLSLSPSASQSPSASPSESPSESLSLSPSASESLSQSPSNSPSPSPGAWIDDTVTWGRVTTVVEVFTRPYAGVWTGTGTISGSGDSEQIELAPGEYMESEMTNLGIVDINFETGKYDATVDAEADLVLYYKDGDSAANCDLDSWNVYSVPFTSSGYNRFRVEHSGT